MNPSPKFSHADRKNLEAELDRCSFRGISLGACSNDLLNQVQHGRGSWRGFRAAAKHIYHVITVLIAAFRQTQRKTGPASIPGPHYVMTCIGSKPHYLMMVRKLAARFEADKVCIVGTLDEVVRNGLGQYKIQHRNSLRHSLSWKDLRELGKLLADVRRTVNSFAEAHGLSYEFQLAVLASTFLAARNVSRFLPYLSATRPKCIITEYDRLSWTSALVKSGRKLNIPSFTLQHGAISGPGWGPLVADRIFCWGLRDKQLLMEHDSVPEQKIVVAGNLMLPESKRSLAGNEVLRVLVATNPIALADRRESLQCVAAAVDRNSSIKVSVKLHPSERLSDYSVLIKNYHHWSFLDSSSGPGDLLIPDFDLLICGNSTLALIAMHLHVPVVLLARDDKPLSKGPVWWLDSGAVVLATNPDEIRQAISDVIENTESAQRRRIRASELSREMFHAGGSSTAELIEKYINNVVATRQIQSADRQTKD